MMWVKKVRSPYWYAPVRECRLKDGRVLVEGTKGRGSVEEIWEVWMCLTYSIVVEVTFRRITSLHNWTPKWLGWGLSVSV